MNWHYAALFHAISAATRQAIQSRLLQDSNPVFLAGLIYSIAAVLIGMAYFLVNGTLWFPGSIPPSFYWVMTIFVIANSVASVLAFNIIKQVALSEVVILMGISAGFMVLAEWIIFNNAPQVLFGWGFSF
ncbi:MAG TPA: hypothetical protein GX706_03925 [Candidatus Moranbacteria bacterium]|nr:hypothetical protein [Candidatus Moranbacteria bacterium]